MTNMNNGISIQDGLSGYSFKFTLIPSGFYSPETAREALSEVVSLDGNDKVEAVRFPEFNAVLLHSGPVDGICRMLKILPELPDYNKIVASYEGGRLYLVLAQGGNLLLCNSFAACDFTTAEYFIFLCMKKFQLNPEVSAITFCTELSQEYEMSLYRYFKNVERI